VGGAVNRQVRRPTGGGMKSGTKKSGARRINRASPMTLRIVAIAIAIAVGGHRY